MDFDVIIIGGGPAGLSAALWCDELGLHSLLLEKGDEFGGQLLLTYNAIENHLGIVAENGRDLANTFLKQIDRRRFVKQVNTFVSEVSEIDAIDKKVNTGDGRSFSAPAIVIATGVRRRKLDIEGLERFNDRGILVSGKRDYHQVVGKTVVIVGGGDAAVENALILSKTAKTIILIHRRGCLTARENFIEELGDIHNTEVLFHSELIAVYGTESIESVSVRNNHSGESTEILTDAVLFRIGIQPNSELVRSKLLLDDSGFVEINDKCESSMNGIFAIGDVATPSSPTISSAVGMGATAIKQIHAMLNS